MGQKVRCFVVILSVVLIIAIGFTVYFAIVKSQKDISVELKSFDNIETLNLSSEYVESVKYGSEFSYPKLLIKATNKSDFINFNVLKNDYYAFNNLQVEGRKNDCYYFKKCGYNFVLIDYGDSFQLYNLCSYCEEANFAFPIIAMLESGFYGWDKLQINSFIPVGLEISSYEGLKNFYEGLNERLVDFDDATQTIKLRAYSEYLYQGGDFLHYSDDYVVALKCSGGGVTVEIMSGEQNA